jgi:prepilin-type N-terminal cleavage/methylation domain-containing protein
VILRAQIAALTRDERGFTLIELLTALAILLTVMVTLTTLMVSATKSEVDLTKRVRAQQDARLALERIRHEIHRACKAEHMILGATPTVDATSGAKTNVRLTPPVSSACPTTPTTYVTWCTEQVATNRWRLRRVSGTPTSCTGGRAEADYITTSTAFTLSHPSGSLMKLNVNFPVDLDPADTQRTYRLEDNLVLRNSSRAA